MMFHLSLEISEIWEISHLMQERISQISDISSYSSASDPDRVKTDRQWVCRTGAGRLIAALRFNRIDSAVKHH
jgi:hypothetical protein